MVSCGVAYATNPESLTLRRLTIRANLYNP